MHNNGQHNPNLRCKKEGAKGFGRPTGNSGSRDNDEMYRGRYTFELPKG